MGVVPTGAHRSESDSRIKNISNDENRLTRINVQKIASLKDLFNNPINEVSFNIKSDEQIHVESSAMFIDLGLDAAEFFAPDKNYP